MLAWQHQSPGFDKIAAGFQFPAGFWPDVARVVLQWERDGLTEEQILQLIALEEANYRSHWGNVQLEFEPSLQPHRKASSADKQKLADDILGSFKL